MLSSNLNNALNLFWSGSSRFLLQRPYAGTRIMIIVAAVCIKGHCSLSLSSVGRRVLYSTSVVVTTCRIRVGLLRDHDSVPGRHRNFFSYPKDETRSTAYPMSCSVEPSFFHSFIHSVAYYLIILLFNYLLCSGIAVISYAVYERM